MLARWLHAVFAIVLVVCGLAAVTPAAAGTPCSSNFTGPLFVEAPGEFPAFTIDDDCHTIYAANYRKNRIDVISIASGTVTGHIAVGGAPSALAVSIDGKTLYAITGVSSISVVDVTAGVETARVPFPAGADAPLNTGFDVAVAANGKVLVSIDTFVKEFDPLTHAFTTRTDFGKNGTYLFNGLFFVSADRSVIYRLYAINSSYRYTAASDSFSGPYTMNEGLFIGLDRAGAVLMSDNGDILNSSLQPIAHYSACCGNRLPFSGNPPVAIDPDGKIAYYLKSSLDVVDLQTASKIGTLSYGSNTAPVYIEGIDYGRPLKISQDGALLALRTTGGFTLMRAADRKAWPVVATPQQGACGANVRSPLAVESDDTFGAVIFDDQCRNAYVSNTSHNRVDIISLATGKRAGSIPVGAGPAGMDVSPDGNTLYVANSAGGNISIVDTTLGKELRRIIVPRGVSTGTPASVAVANTGLVLIAMDLPAGIAPYNLAENARLVQLDPATDVVVGLSVTASASEALPGRLRLRASGDRSVIAIADEGSPNRLHRFEAAAGQVVAVSNLSGTASDAASDRTGAITVTATGQMFNAFNQSAGSLPFGATRTFVAVAPATSVAYAAVAGSDSISVFSLSSKTQTDTLAAGARVKATDASLITSRDGSLLAVLTGGGFSIVRTTGPSTTPTIPEIQTVLVSTANGGVHQSFLRLHNTGTTPGTARITLRDPASGNVLTQWTSPQVLPGSSPQFAVQDIETTGGITDKPFTYIATVSATFQGTLSQLMVNSRAGTISNLTTCDSGGAGPGLNLANIHSAQVGPYPSFLAVSNTAQTPAPLVFGIADARDGHRLGTATLPDMAAGEGRLIATSDIVQAAGIAPADGLFHYVITIESALTGTVQHLLQNEQPGDVADFTAVCRLAGS